MARDADAAVATLQTLVAEMTRRNNLMYAYDVSGWPDLHGPALASGKENIRPILVIIDEYVSTVMPHQLPKGLDKEDSALYREACAENEVKEQIMRMTAQILREGRFAGIHLVIGTQRPDAQILGAEMRSHISTDIMVARPGYVASGIAIDMAFPRADREAVTAAVEKASSAVTHGNAVLATERGTVMPLRFGLTR